MGEVIEYHQFEDCFQECQKPIRMFQTMIKQNVLAIGRNQKACMEPCRTKEGSAFYDCNSECMKKSTEAVGLLDKKISDDCIINEDRIFGKL